MKLHYACDVKQFNTSKAIQPLRITSFLIIYIMLVEMIMTARFFIVVLAVSLALGEGGSTQPSLSSASASLEVKLPPYIK